MDRVARFEREARALAALNHPGIAAIHSFEEVSGRHLLVMELAEGEGSTRESEMGPRPSRKPSRLRDRSPKRWKPPTRRGSSTAT